MQLHAETAKGQHLTAEMDLILTDAEFIRELILDAEALLEKLDKMHASPAAAYVASAIEVLKARLEELD